MHNFYRFYIDWLLAGLRKIDSLESDERSLLAFIACVHCLNVWKYFKFFGSKRAVFSIASIFLFFANFRLFQTVFRRISFPWNTRRSSYQRNKALNFFASLQGPYLKLNKKNRRIHIHFPFQLIFLFGRTNMIC